MKATTTDAVRLETHAWLKRLVANPCVVFIFRLLLGATFLLSAIGKLVDIERYSVDAVYNFGVVPFVLARPLGLVLPFVELLCALGLLFGVLTRLSAFGVALMSLIFFLAKADVLLIQHRSIECGCFGAIMTTMASVTIYLDLPMVLMGLVIMLAPPAARDWLSLAKWAPRSLREMLDLIW